MVYGYIRVSTDKQTTDNQRFEINKFVADKEMIVERWINEEISGTKEINKRKIGKQFKRMKADDIIICTELSRLGRSLLMILGFLNECMKRQIKVWTIKDNYRLGDDISSKVLAFAFGLSAEIERNLISQRTKEALARKKAEGVVLGRPKGALTKRENKLAYKKEKQIVAYLKKGIPLITIAKLTGIHRLTIGKYVRDYHLMNEVDEVLVEEGTKKCVCCFKAKPLSEFTKHAKYKDGYHSYCNPCHRGMANVKRGADHLIPEELQSIENQLKT